MLVRGRAYGGCSDVLSATYAFSFPTSVPEKALVKVGASATFTTHSGVAHSFRPLGRSGPRSFLKAECTIVGSCAYFSEQGQEVISIVVVIFPECWRSDERSDPHPRVYINGH